jgi:sulfur carrier protein ThiS
MIIYIEKEDKELKKRFSGNVKKLLKELKINPQTVVVVKNDSLVAEDEKLEDSDHVRLLSVVSGG